MDTIRIEIKDGVASIRLHRPEVRNALNEVLIAELTQAFTTLPESVRVVILAGEGTAFCSGADAAWMKKSATFSREENERDAAALAALLKAVDECPRPVLARVQGAVLGGGVGLVAACDVAVADAGAQFGFPEVRLGLIPAVISTFVLPRIGARAARRYFLTGERFGAPRAQALGLVHEVTTPDQLDSTIDGIVRDLLQAGPRALSAAKKLIRDVAALPREQALRETIRAIAEIRVSPEAQEGLGAFLEKRKPRWP
ncbi:MAG TPA: enoyl-CoA hydratase-related protein [Planctomycetota bacterium]|jgi:methylglutaconyl-CoA hydratase|nr:enoyl-CoA hydratase-related protein [Planctomycetota bacterium]